MPPKRCYEIGESSNNRTISEEAKARRRAYLESWRNWRSQSDDEVVNQTPPQAIEEPHPANVLVPSASKGLQDPNDPVSNTEKGYMITSTGEKVSFKWGKCIKVCTKSDEDWEEDDEEDPKEESEEDPEEASEEESEENSEESEEDPEEEPEEMLEEEDEVEEVEEILENEQEPLEVDDEERDEIWEINSDEDQPLDEDEDVGHVIEQQPEELELSGPEVDDSSSDDDVN